MLVRIESAVLPRHLRRVLYMNSMRTAFILLTVGVAASSAASDEDYQNALDLLGLSKDDVAGLQASKARRAEQSGPSIDTEGNENTHYIKFARKNRASL